MTDAQLTEELATRVMLWTVAKDRFITSGRSWIPRWRFRPFEELADAFQLLERAADWFNLKGDCHNVFTVEVQIGGRHGTGTGEQIARTITTAVVQALGIQV